MRFAYGSSVLQHIRRSPIRTSALGQLDAETVASFCEHLEQTRGNSAHTRNARLATIKSFMRFVENREPVIIDQSYTVH